MNPGLLNIVSYIMAQSETELNQMLRNFNQTCKSSMDGPLVEYGSKSFMQLTQHIALDSFASVKRCWYRNIPLDCKRAFLNLFNEYSLAFSFNVDRRTLAYLIYDDLVQYGLDSHEYLSLNVSNVGPSNGFRVELDINHNELCGSFHKYTGAGFVAMVHNPVIVPPFYAMTPAVYLSPGYFYDIGAKVQIIKRKTKNLGYCNDRLGNQSETGLYTQEACYAYCFFQQLTHKCHCTVPPIKGYLSLMHGLNIPTDKYTMCSSVKDLKCFSSLMTTVIGNWNYCPYECLPACSEMKYQLHVKSTKYPLHSPNNGTLVANFYLSEMMVDYVDEFQGYMVTDLALDIAGIIFTFLGLSLMNIAEGLFEICIFAIGKVVGNMNRI